ncbi:MAG: hypothetical protein MK108_10135 [Mariniblastus sp.]|nr:hypothetical protein [Mariniblastus sp.]
MPLPDKNPLTVWLAQVLGPILIMGMVGSLVFFFIEIVYRGPHATRLCWVLGLFTIASVLVSRVSIQEGFERASFFGLALAIATLITSTVIVDFDYGLKIFEPVTIVVLIGMVMWSSSKLTWDCTVVDNSRDVSASGLLDFAARRFRRSSQASQSLDRSTDESRSEERETTAENSQIGRGILQRLFSRAGRQNTPGLWVFYFSLFALPVFGMGQWFADSHSRVGDTWIFLLFAVYLGSGLGLLMVTSLLGLNRYLGRRNLPLPLPIAQGWLTIGSLLAVLMMGLVLLIPRPDMAGGTSDALAWFSSTARRASDKALGRDGQQRGPQGNSSVRSEAGKKVPGPNAKTAGPQSSNQASQSQSGQGQGQSGRGQQSTSGNRSRGSAEQKSGRSSSGERSSGQQQGRGSDSSKRGESGEKSGSSGNPPAGRSGQSNEDRSGQSGERSNPGQRSGDRAAGQRGQKGGPTGPKRAPNERDAADKDEGDEEDDEKERDEQSEGQGAEGAEAKPSSAGSARSSGNPGSAVPPPVPRGLSSGLATLGKAFLFLIGLAALVALVWLYRDELAELWAKWLGGKKRATAASETVPEQRERKPEFRDFADPFRTGRGSQWTERQLIQYTYSALEAWARGRQYEKEADETPYEFARQIQLFDRVVGHQAVELARLYCRAEYSQQVVRRGELKPLLQLWQEMSSRSVASA